MAPTSTITAMRSAARILTRPTAANALATTRALNNSAPALKNPPLKGPVPTEQAEEVKEGGEGFLGALLYGSKAAKGEGLVAKSNDSHSKLVGRGKYVHEKVTHSVIPSKREEYMEAAEKYFKQLMARGKDDLGGVKLTASWETVVGAVGEFTHVLEYEGFKGFDETSRALRKDSEMKKLNSAILPNITSRQHQIISEFSFWPSSPPRDSGYPDGGVFEMRTYQLQPGTLLQWEHAWRRGLEARRKFVQPVGAFFSQVGQLHEVHHIWQYPDMETRKRTRDQAWGVGTWSDTVSETVKLTQNMKSAILIPCPWSPLR